MAEVMIRDEVKDRTLVERVIVGARMAQAADWDQDALPDVDQGMSMVDDWLAADDPEEVPDLADPMSDRRASLGLSPIRRGGFGGNAR